MAAFLDEVMCIKPASRGKVWGAWLTGVNLQLSQHLKVIISPVQVAAYRATQFGAILMPISLPQLVVCVAEYSVHKANYTYLMAVTYFLRPVSWQAVPSSLWFGINTKRDAK